MKPNEIRTTLLSQKQRVAEATQGCTVVSCSPDNELTAMAALLVPKCSLATGSIAELLAELPQELEQLLVICDDTLPDGGALELMRQLREAQPQATCRFLVSLPKSTAQPRLEQLLAHGADALCCRSSGGSGAVLSALVQVLHGMQSVDGAFRKRLQRSRRCTEQPALSSPELELIHLTGEGAQRPPDRCLAAQALRQHSPSAQRDLPKNQATQSTRADRLGPCPWRNQASRSRPQL